MTDSDIHLPQKLLDQIRRIGESHHLSSIVLFGSRARGDHMPRSDIDLAICTEDVEQYFTIIDDLEELETLLRFDVVNLSSDLISNDLRDEIQKDGVIIYEKV